MNENLLNLDLKPMKALPKATVKLIGSAQVITSVSSVVKELIENSIDAGATNIEIKLENNGIDRIEVKDNGCGVQKEDVPFMCKRSYTSKISDFSDLDKLSSYGFRGEALCALCSIADVSITTITDLDNVASTYVFDHNGDVISTSTSHLNKGTSVVAAELFKNLPVRKQYLSSGKRRGDEIKKVENIVKHLALINPGVRFVLTHNKFTIWQKSAACSIMSSFVQILPPTLVKLLHEINYNDERFKIILMVPKRDCHVLNTCYKNPMDSIFLFVNSRPVRDKQIEKAIHEEVFHFFSSAIPQNKEPTCLASLVLPSDSLDVNLEPNKTKVIIKDSDELIKLIKKLIYDYYFAEFPEFKIEQENKKRKNEEDDDDLIEVEAKIPKTELDGKDQDDTVDKIEVSPVKQNNMEIEEYDLKKAENVLKRNEQEISDLVQSIFRKQDFSEPLDENGIGEKMEIQTSWSDGNAEFNEETQETTVPNVESSSLDVPESHLLEKSDLDNQTILLSDWSRGNIEFNEETIQETTVPNVESSSLDMPESHLLEKSDLDNQTISLSDWSRGNIEFNGKMIQSPVVVASGVDRIVSVSETSVPSPSSQRSVSSQMGQKEMAAFTKFAREARSQIIKESPGISFTTVASELANKWKNLKEDEKQVYQEIAQAQKEKKKIEKSFSTPSPIIVKKKESLQKVEKPLKKVYPKIKTWKITLELIHNSIKNRKTSFTALEKIGKLNDLTIVRDGGSLVAFSCARLKESMKYFNNLSHMSVPTKVLEQSIPVNKSDIGSCWDVLSSLETTFDEKTLKMVIADEKLVKNGLRIEKHEEEADFKYFITDVPLNIAFFGVDDLLELLEILKVKKSCKVAECRPLKVISFIRSETIRSLTDSGRVNDSYVLEVYKFWRDKIRQNTFNCPHYNPVCKSLLELS